MSLHPGILLRIRQVPVCEQLPASSQPVPGFAPGGMLRPGSVIVQINPAEFITTAAQIQDFIDQISAGIVSAEEAMQDVLGLADATMTLTGTFSADVLADLIEDLPPE